MSSPVGYSLVSYGDMIADRTRMGAYARALRQAVRPGCVVLDIGTGTGIFALLACQFGARHVYAVEPDPAIVVAKATAAANGYADRITFLQEVSTAITLPERADVIVSDLRGVLPLMQYHVAAIADARQRLLAPGGRLIPQRDTLWASLVEHAELYKRYAEPWVRNDYGLDLHAGQRFVVNTWQDASVEAEHLLVPPVCWGTLDYGTITDPNVHGELSWIVERNGIAHGLLLWFDATLEDGIGFSNAPGAPKTIYRQAFFPFEEPLTLAVDERVTVRVAADLIGNDYVWRWDTDVFSAGRPSQPRARFRQSTFFGSPLPLDRLHKRAEQYVPSLGDEGRVDLVILQLMSQAQPLGVIARQVAEQFPARFSTWQDALARVGDLAEKYAR